MTKEIILKGEKINYDLSYKKVKNINLRIKPDGSVFVSANRFVSQKAIEEFMILKADFILSALRKFEKNKGIPQTQFFSEEELTHFITSFSKEAYGYYEKFGIKYPEIKFRKMVSRWGSCHTKKRYLTFNTYLMYAPKRCVEYVVWHEFTHFLQPNHSKKFYDELEKVCPHWKELRKELKEIKIC